jgi:formylglycine-generating enzyme required for sulfatase activity
MVSDLITIEDFQEFSISNSLYLEARANVSAKEGLLDNLEAVNADEDTKLPISLTWYDVMAFISWFNRKNKVETRLLTIDEFMEVSPFMSP